MTVVTGKGGRYRYYKCTARVNKGNRFCQSRNLPMEQVDTLVLEQLIEQVFTVERLTLMLREARRQLWERKDHDQQELGRLQGELRKADQRLARLYDAIERGTATLDDTLEQRIRKARDARASLLVEMAGLRRVQALPTERVLPSQVEAFSRVIRAKLQDRTSPFAKDYLHAVVDEITVHDDTATVTGSNGKLLQVVGETKKGTDQVPSCV